MDRAEPSSVKKILFNGEICAIKVLKKDINNSKEANSIDNPHTNSNHTALKEISIHKALKHKFIVKYITHFDNATSFNIIMEYVEYNLRNLIIPEIGLDPIIGHMIFVQLLEGVKYLHSNGICHRDIKPDNILMDRKGNIRLCDFGHSTMFKLKEYRRLKTIAGTPEFMAPEILKRDYDGQMADIFSMGITLVNILTGKLPWTIASPTDKRYVAYTQMKYHCYDPFNRIREPTLRLIEGMLKSESKRIAIKTIEQDQWVRHSTSLIDSFTEMKCKDPSFLNDVESAVIDLHYTQPDILNSRGCSILNKKSHINISQPVKSINQPTLYRFYVDGNCKTSINSILSLLENMAVICQRNSNGILFSTTDTKRNKLMGEIIIQEINGSSVITVRRTKGDLVEFKKFFLYLNSHIA
ncbi:CAMK/CAMKL/CHK1 protein kinase [Vittaforma corneae ATCC 50505]|uniref:non-specific serine/threonine protein kinase n=1 Tax=Vittaforma corneae (strain ATCC 50505) TaxID=993615 RepID=L2GNT2_VITCO|nr:CAMK/CAMKL/CHK1 protein kinase [Vittaforma corneae ATCC 50505]ELA42279.1 CAMK/CAMKL/CHK1 protein kinase [Vittaforma corneae ATCC 50505]